MARPPMTASELAPLATAPPVGTVEAAVVARVAVEPPPMAVAVEVTKTPEEVGATATAVEDELRKPELAEMVVGTELEAEVLSVTLVLLSALAVALELVEAAEELEEPDEVEAPSPLMVKGFDHW